MAQKCEALWMLRVPGRGENVGWGAPLPWPQLPAPCPSASCLSPREPGAFQEHCPREEDPGSPLDPGWPQMASGLSSSPRKNGTGAQDGFAWARSVLRTGLANRTSFPKLRKGLEINAGEGCRLHRVDGGPPACCSVARSASPALSQPFPRRGWGPGGLLSRQILLQGVGWVETTGPREEPGGGRPEPIPREAPPHPTHKRPHSQCTAAFYQKNGALEASSRPPTTR